MSSAEQVWTAREFRRLPPETRVQLVEGGLVMEPSPNLDHQQILMNLCGILDSHVRAANLGRVYVAPLDVYLSEHNVFQPDLMFIATANLGILANDGLHGVPDLAIEILSISTARLDARTKRRLYCQYGVEELWLIDPILLQIHRYDFERDPGKPIQLIDEEECFSTPLLPGLTIRAAEVFRR